MALKPVNIISLLLACLYIYGGSGFSLADFCCSACKEKGIEMLLADGCHQEEETDSAETCCTSHSEEENPVPFSVCKQHCHHVAHCNVTSYQVDLEDTVYKCKCQVPVFQLAYFIPELSLPDNFYRNFTYKTFIDPPVLIYSSRDILAENSVLLI
ncbi:MAG: hypothetical protein LUG18_08445 [Candidatus Azobacteroides sp.]|nr:hypothetical protein [Candidatus Azobacteroides sp.]